MCKGRDPRHRLELLAAQADSRLTWTSKNHHGTCSVGAAELFRPRTASTRRTPDGELEESVRPVAGVTRNEVPAS
jgi:hypothetical protein